MKGAFHEIEVPKDKANKGYKFAGWEPRLPTKYSKITESVTYTAKFVKDEKKWCTINFVSGENGSLIGETEIEVLKGTSWHSIAEPEIEADRGYRFVS